MINLRAYVGLLKLADDALVERKAAPDAVEGDDGYPHCVKCGTRVPENAQACPRCKKPMHDIRANGKEDEVSRSRAEQEPTETMIPSRADESYNAAGVEKLSCVVSIVEGTYGFTKLARAGNPILSIRRKALLKKWGLLSLAHRG